MAISTETPVLVVGGGPSGLILALQLACHGIKCTIVERNDDTTKWPKMDITNVRSMELFRRLGIADGLKEIGVPGNYSFDVLFSTGLGDGGQLITKWDLPSPDEWRERIRSENDGSMPREPYQRCSQAVLEAWLKPRIQANPLIESHFGVKFETLEEMDDYVTSHLINVSTGEKYVIRSQYVVGCDGAGSRVRKAIGGQLIGGPVPGAMFLVHFKSRDLPKLHKQGQFWHIFFPTGAAILSQDEVDTWTTHLPIPLDADWEKMDAKEAIYKVLGGCVGSFPIEVDEILVKSSWRPNICIADRYASQGRRVFLSGDSAHQNIPTGGYGMNTAVGDSFDIGWKIAAILKGFGGRGLLDSYEVERMPVGIRNIDRSGAHFSVHGTYNEWVKAAGESTVISDSPEGHALRDRIKSQVTAHDGENKDHGIEIGYRYKDSPIVVSDSNEPEPEWNSRQYIPSTWPGARAPSVFLADGETNIYDLFGREYTIIDFTDDGHISQEFMIRAAALGIPLTRRHLPSEQHAHSVWQRSVVLIRPDDHVAWRSPIDASAPLQVDQILRTVTGQVSSDEPSSRQALQTVQVNGFTGTVGNEEHSKIQMLAAFQH